MTIAELDREVAGLIERYHIYGLEALINSTVRAVIDEPYADADYIKRLVDTAYRREMLELEEPNEL